MIFLKGLKIVIVLKFWKEVLAYSFQNEILKEEYDLLGLKPNLPSSHIIEVEQENIKR